MEHAQPKKITVKLLKIKGHTFREKEKKPIVKKCDFASPYNINNFDDAENSRG